MKNKPKGIRIHEVNVKNKQIAKLDAGYCCICSGNAIYKCEDKINEIIAFLNTKNCIHEVTTLNQDNCGKCGKSILEINNRL